MSTQTLIRPTLDVKKIRQDFPILRQTIRGNPLVYFDNAATSQKPQFVIDAIRRYYEVDNANVHRGVHTLSERATRAYEGARDRITRYINAAHRHEVIFTRGTTESINIVAQSYGRKHLGPGDEVIISTMEHHSNIVPWQMICDEREAVLRVVPIDEDGDLVMDQFERMLNPRTKIVALVHVSNSLGTINPVDRIIELAHARGIPVLLDGAQAMPHMRVDVQALDVDFYAFSGHKMFGPTGIGILYGKSEYLEDMPPWQGGGDMIRTVSFERTTYNELPYRFEAGTPHIAGAIGFGAAVDYMNDLDMEAVAAHEHDLLDYGTSLLSDMDGVRLIGTAKEKASVISFVVDGAHPHHVGTLLDPEGIAVRTGHHCTQPVMERYGLPAPTPASPPLYNTREELDALAAGVRKVIEVFR